MTSTEREFPNRIEVNGEWKSVTWHLKSRARRRGEVTPSSIKYVLENWLVRCVNADQNGRLGMVHWGEVRFRGKAKMMLVSLSLDGARITSAYIDGNATDAWENGETGYFDEQCLCEMEMSDEFAGTDIRP